MAAFVFLFIVFLAAKDHQGDDVDGGEDKNDGHRRNQHEVADGEAVGEKVDAAENQQDSQNDKVENDPFFAQASGPHLPIQPFVLVLDDFVRRISVFLVKKYAVQGDNECRQNKNKRHQSLQ